MSLRMRSLVVAGIIGMLFAALGVGVVLAEGRGDGEKKRSDGGTGSGYGVDEEKQEYRAEGRAAFAEALGLTVDELDAAARKVALDRVSEAVESGELTEDEATEIRTKIESSDAGDWHPRGRGFGFQRGGEALAEELGVTVDDLQAAMRQVLLDRIDAAVEAGKISAERGEELKTAIESGEKPDRDGRPGGRHGFGKAGNWSHEKDTDETTTTE